MILSTHAIVGAAIASFLPSHPATAFVLGFGSHFVLDAIPHWDYPISSASVNPKIGAPLTFDRGLLRDLALIGSDGLLGILGALLLFASSEGLWSILLGKALTSQVEKKPPGRAAETGQPCARRGGGTSGWPGEIFARTAFLVARALSRRRLGQATEE